MNAEALWPRLIWRVAWRYALPLMAAVAAFVWLNYQHGVTDPACILRLPLSPTTPAEVS